MTSTVKSLAAVCPRTSVAPFNPIVCTSLRNGSGAGVRISPWMPGIDVPRKVIAMIYWQDKLVGFIAEAIRSLTIVAILPTAFVCFAVQDGYPLATECGLLLLSQVVVNGLRSPPSR